jgi:hypothetical protein
VAVGVWYAGLFAAAVAAAVIFGHSLSSHSRQQTLLVLALAMLMGLTAVHAVFWSDLRMRAPVMPLVAALAAAGLLAGGRWLIATTKLTLARGPAQS